MGSLCHHRSLNLLVLVHSGGGSNERRHGGKMIQLGRLKIHLFFHAENPPSLRILGMSWGIKNTFFEAPGVSLGGSGVSIGGVKILRAETNSKFTPGKWIFWKTILKTMPFLLAISVFFF